MTKHSLRSSIAVVLCIVLVLCSSEAFAWRDSGHHDNHFYRDGRWYRHGWLGFDIAVTALAIGSLVDALPPRHTTIVVAGVAYYYYDNVYYRPYTRGYVVVPPPVVTQAIIIPPSPIIAQPQPLDTVTINIPNSRGGYTAITLRKLARGYIGPQGEYYLENPTVDQLKTLYGN